MEWFHCHGQVIGHITLIMHLCDCVFMNAFYCVLGIKQDSGSGRPAPLLQEPRFGAGPQPYRK